MVGRHDPLFVRPLFVTEIECGDVEALAKVDWVTDSCPAYVIVSLNEINSLLKRLTRTAQDDGVLSMLRP